MTGSIMAAVLHGPCTTVSYEAPKVWLDWQQSN